MPRYEFGLLCPEGHGILIERADWDAQGVAWCPHSEHDINDNTAGRFYRKNEVEQGRFDPDAPRIKSQRLLEHEAQVAARAEARKEHERIMAEKIKEKKPSKPRERKAKEPQNCQCGCGGQTKGGRFIPGHDARFHSRVRLLEAAGISHEEAAKVASQGPLTGKYAAITAPPEKPAKEAKPKAEKKAKAESVPVEEEAPAIAAE